MSLYYSLMYAICFVVPFIFAYIHRKPLQQKQQFKLFNPSVIIAAVPFILIDYIAASLGWWSFEESRLLGIKVGILPLEEIFFFIVIPQSCLLIWAFLSRSKTVSDFWKDITHHIHN